MAIKVTLNDEQKEALKALKKFAEHPAADTFVLQGYAGTGKTFLMQHFAQWLKSEKHKFTLLASTGRAATILKGKTGFAANTVHAELYRFSSVDGDTEDIPEDAPVDKFGQMTLQFSLRSPDSDKKIYIVDEASMLSSEPGTDINTPVFGSGHLLSDFFDAAGNNKIIFVGDPGQLPPVGQTFSPALDINWLAAQGRTAIMIKLEKIERNTAGNDILFLATMVRTMDETVPDFVRFPKLPASNMKNVTIHSSFDELLANYLAVYKTNKAGGTLAVARSNRLVDIINNKVRTEVYGDASVELQAGEILMVVQNNQAVPLTNGDFATVISTGSVTIHVGLYFQQVRVRSQLTEMEYDVLLSLDVLRSKEGNLSHEQSRQLMIEFSRVAKRKGIKANSPEYKEAMRKDKHLNCLKAKFGYAVTCHKSQGGEWNEVYLFLEKSMYGMPRHELFRWWYTAITRAKTQLHLAKDWWIL